MFCPLRADVAQLVEQRFRKPQVTGSNPVVGSSLRNDQLVRIRPFRLDYCSYFERRGKYRAAGCANYCVRGSVSGNLPIRLIEQNGAEFGLASAIMSGARAAQGEILLVMDADLSHPPERIKDLLAPLFAGTADLVVGSRYVKGGSTPGWPVWRRIMSRAGAALAYPLTGLHDSMCGFFAIGRSRLLELAPHTSGFKIVFETMVRGGDMLRVREIPIAFRDRAHGKSKMSFSVALRFFFRWLLAMFQYVVRGLRPRGNGAKLARTAEALHPEAPGK